MKKCIVVFAVALLFAALMPLPAAAKVDVNFGIKGGISLAKVKWSDATESSSSLPQPVFGAFAAINLNKNIAIQPEVYWLTLGGRYVDAGDIDFYEYKMLLHYIHIPVLAKFSFMADKNIRPIIFAGPAIDLLMSARQKYYINGVLDEDMDIKPFLTTANFSVVFGTGVEYMMKKARIIVDIRYDMGLADINNKGTDKLKTSALMFMLGIGL